MKDHNQLLNQKTGQSKSDLKHHFITIKDIAKALNVSVSTVSRAMCDAYDVSKETREKVKTLPTEKVKIVRKLDTEKRKEALDEIAEKNQSVKEARDTVKKHSDRNSETSRKTENRLSDKAKENEQQSSKTRIKELKTEIRELENKLSSAKAELARLEKI